jgi:FkbH-like protein
MTPEDALKDLQNDITDLSKVMQANKVLLASESFDKTVEIGISSNITLNLLDVFLTKHSLLNFIKPNINIGNYDDVSGDMERFKGQGVTDVIFFPFFDNIMPSFESQIGNLPKELVKQKIDDFFSKTELALNQAEQFKSVNICLFHNYIPFDENTNGDDIKHWIETCNERLISLTKEYPNTTTFDTNPILSKVGINNAFDHRFYARSKAPYSKYFLNSFASSLLKVTRGFKSYYYKALVLDCDNTLWGGIAGEDLIGGIKLDPYDYPGNIYWRVQNSLLALQKQGVLLCLCSKNNPEDVDHILADHPSIVIKDKNILLKKVNWNDKASNIKEIATELDIGLDSIVFIDDSSFECDAVRSQLPMVKTFQVPKNIADYPKIISEVSNLFSVGKVSKESLSKTEQYRIRASAEKEKARFNNQEEYLAALELKVIVSIDRLDSVERISELTQKSNQFNLTTKRYSESDILSLMKNDNSSVFSFVVKDKFGNHGITGVLIALFDKTEVVIDAFLMSCRVIGRGIEYSLWQAVSKKAQEFGSGRIKASYLPTQKNAQVENFFDNLGLKLIHSEQQNKFYELELKTFQPPEKKWVELSYEY